MTTTLTAPLAKMKDLVVVSILAPSFIATNSYMYVLVEGMGFNIYWYFFSMTLQGVFHKDPESNLTLS